MLVAGTAGALKFARAYAIDKKIKIVLQKWKKNEEKSTKMGEMRSSLCLSRESMCVCMTLCVFKLVLSDFKECATHIAKMH